MSDHCHFSQRGMEQIEAVPHCRQVDALKKVCWASSLNFLFVCHFYFDLTALWKLLFTQTHFIRTDSLELFMPCRACMHYMDSRKSEQTEMYPRTEVFTVFIPDLCIFLLSNHPKCLSARNPIKALLWHQGFFSFPRLFCLEGMSGDFFRTLVHASPNKKPG